MKRCITSRQSAQAPHPDQNMQTGRPTHQVGGDLPRHKALLSHNTLLSSLSAVCIKSAMTGRSYALGVVEELRLRDRVARAKHVLMARQATVRGCQCLTRILNR